MLTREPRLRTIIGINLRLAYASLLLLSGWACWQWTSKAWWGLGIMASLLFAGATVLVIATIHRTVAMFARQRKIDAFNRQGGTARADRMARERDLRDRGMIR